MIRFLLNVVTILSLLFLIMRGFALAESPTEWGRSREPASDTHFIKKGNESEILKCLDKLTGKLESSALSSLNELKTLIEMVYSFRKSQLNYRELVYKTTKGENWRIEASILNEGVPGREKYRVKFYKRDEIGGTWPQTPNPDNIDNLSKEELLRWAQMETVSTDERWEQLLSPMDPMLSFKSTNFQIFELNLKWKKKRQTLHCEKATESYICSCISI